MTPGTRNDGLHLQLSGSDVVGLSCTGTMPGVVVNGAAANNGPGVGTLISTKGGLLAWQAPGSQKSGARQVVSAGGTFMLEDGQDQSKWINVAVYPPYLPASGQSIVTLADTYNDMGPADVDAADASAGLVTTTEYMLANVSGANITAARAWLDATASGFADLAISSDGTNYYSPTSPTDSHVLSWSSITAGLSVPLYVKRTIAASSASAPSILNVLHWQWAGL